MAKSKAQTGEPITWTESKRTLGELVPWPRNPRQINKDQAKRLQNSFEEFGQVETIAVGPTNDVYNGHQRLNVLMAQHGPDYAVDVRVSSRALNEKEREKLTVYLHKGASGEFNWDELANWNIPELLEWGFEKSDFEMHGIDLDAQCEPAADPGAQVDKADELREKWQTSLGQLWQIGRHRLICGDCTDASAIERLMQDEKAALVMADPPYNVEYTGGSTNDRERADSYQDAMSDADYTQWLVRLLKNGHRFSDDRAALMLWFASAKMRCIMDGFEGAGWTARTLIVWNKLKAHYGALGAQYKHKYEPLWYCFKPGKSPRFFGATNETTVWDFDQPRINDLHPTMKPVELYQRCVSNHSQKGDIVLELFSGSGTTLVACETLGRCGRATEIDPKFVAVALERLAQMGLTPVLQD